MVWLEDRTPPQTPAQEANFFGSWRVRALRTRASPPFFRTTSGIPNPAAGEKLQEKWRFSYWGPSMCRRALRWLPPLPDLPAHLVLGQRQVFSVALQPGGRYIHPWVESAPARIRGDAFSRRGVLMKFGKPALLLAVLLSLSSTSCTLYHGKGSGSVGGGGGGGGGGTTAAVSFTMVSDTPPPNLGLISFTLSISSIKVTSSTGTVTTLDLGTFNNGAGLLVDLVRAQTDSIYLGKLTDVATGTISSVTVAFANPQLSFFNGTGANITNLSSQCLLNAVCTTSFNTTGAPVITSSLTVSGNTGFAIDFNLRNAFTLTGTSLSLNLTNSGSTNVVTAVALPRSNSDLAAGQLDLLEDITGVVSLANGGVTIKPATAVGRQTITANTTSTTVYDADPAHTLCPGGTSTLSGCVAAGEVASMDAILNSDGTFTVQEIEPLLASPTVDTVEGTVYGLPGNNPSEFVIIITDVFPAASNSKISTLTVGQPLTVNIGTVAAGGFLVDTKGLLVGGPLANFQGATTTGAIHQGQTVAVHVTSFTAASGTTPALVNTDLVTMRWSRFFSTLNTSGSPEFSVNTLLGAFGFQSSINFDVETFPGTPGADGITNLDGVPSGSTANLAAGPVAVRALFLENTTNTQDPAFFAAKVRQP